MSTSSTSTQYSFNLSNQPASGSGTMNVINFVVVSTGEFTDADAFALCNAWKGLPWPSGQQVAATVTKVDSTSTSYTTDSTATPPSFT